MRRRMMSLVGVLLVFVSVFAAAEDGPGMQGQGDIDQDYVLQRGDTLSISVWRHQDLTQQLVVDETGNITFPLLGELKVEGLTIAQLKEYLTYLLGKDYIVDPFVTVTVDRPKTDRQFYVYGEVRQPGAYKIEGNLTVLKAITLSGGMTDYASQVVYVKRRVAGREKRIRVNINNVIKGAEADVPIQQDDIVVVTRRVF